MYKIDYVEGATKPNPKVATFKINTDFLGQYSKIIIPKDGVEILKYARLARALYIRGGDANRIDLTNQGSDTLISISRKLIDFNDNSKLIVKTRLNEFFNETEDFVPVDLQGIEKNIPVQKPLNLSDHPIKFYLAQAFEKIITPLLQEDGGAMELVDIEYNKLTGNISTTVALVGSCNNCSSANGRTLSYAFNQLTEVLNGIKHKYAGNEKFSDIQKMTLESIKSTTSTEMVFKRK